MRAMVFVVFAACAVGDVELESVAFTGQNDGFGFHCEQVYSPTSLITECHSADGDRGICAYRDVCRQRCTGADSGCPTGYVAVPTVGVDDETGLGNCYCQPERCATGSGTIACGPVDVSL
jgi:hypothetical protein